MERTHRYKVVTGKHAGKVVEGFHIGHMLYPDQIAIEKMEHEQVMSLYTTNKDGFWCPELAEKIDFESKISSANVGEVVDYGNVHDLVITFDKYNKEIFVDDILYAAVKNAVRRVKVTKITKTATFALYGILQRKLTVTDLDTGKTLTINESRDTILDRNGETS